MSEQRVCYISRNYYDLTSAGSKAKTDNEDTLQAMGAVNIGRPRSVNPNKIAGFFLDLAGIVRACRLLRRGDLLFLQYPVKKYFTLLCRVARLKGAHSVALIHDLGSFRRKKLRVEDEIRRLGHCDYVLASNARMQQWLVGNGLKSGVGALGLFDYHSKSMPLLPTSDAHAQIKVVYAGALNMRKNAFLVALSHRMGRQNRWQLLVCGNKEGLQGLDENPQIMYKGFVPSEAFIAQPGADFGLVWDGDSLDGCTGAYGTYLRWNSPHKVSFYLRAGLPVIIWREAAVAPIIEAAEAGIVIDSLPQLDGILRDITPEQLLEMKQNARRLAERLDQGCYLKEALGRISF